MAPKKATSKTSKKEEVVEIPKTADIPDGLRVEFIGGWSSRRSLSALTAISRDSRLLAAVASVYLLPGELIIDPTPSEMDPTVLSVRTLSITALAPSQLLEAPAAANDEVLQQTAHDGDAEEETDLKTPPPKEPRIERHVVVKHRIRFEAWIPPPPPPPEPKAVSAAPPEKALTAALKGTAPKEKKKAVVIDDEPKEAAPAPSQEPPAVGADPSSWPTLTFRGVCFDAPLETKGVHLTFEECSFSASTTAEDDGRASGTQIHLVAVHQYCRVSFTRCTFAKSIGSCIYAYPCANVTAVGCVFSGSELDADSTYSSSPQDRLSTVNSRSVGIFADDAIIQCSVCKFRDLAVGVLLHDKCAASSVRHCDFDRITNIGCLLESTQGAVNGCTFRRCAYYALRSKGRTTAKVLNNTFDSIVRTELGATPTMFGNTCALPLVDDNNAGCVFMEPRY